MTRIEEFGGTVTPICWASCQGVSGLCIIFPASVVTAVEVTTCAWVSRLTVAPAVRLPATALDWSAAVGVTFTDAVAVYDLGATVTYANALIRPTHAQATMIHQRRRSTPT